MKARFFRRVGVGAVTPRRLRTALGNVVFVVVACAAALLVWPTNLGGCTTLTIVSGESMEPTYYAGDLVVSRCGDPVVGDVAVYQPADLGGARVIHRVVAGSGETGWVMRGDNNDTVDPWTPSRDEVLGVARLRLAGVGFFALLLLSPLFWAAFVVIAVGLLLWPASEPEEDLAGTDRESAKMPVERNVLVELELADRVSLLAELDDAR